MGIFTILEGEQFARDRAAERDGEAFFCDICDIWSWTYLADGSEYVDGCECA